MTCDWSNESQVTNHHLTKSKCIFAIETIIFVRFLKKLDSAMQGQLNTTKEIREHRAPLYQKLVKLMWGLSILGVIVVAALFFTLSYSDLPSFEELENPKNNLASEVLSLIHI